MGARRIYLNTTQPFFEIVEGGTTVDLDAEEYRQYIHVRVNNYRKYFDENGNMETTNHFSEITRCTKNFYKEFAHGEE